MLLKSCSSLKPHPSKRPPPSPRIDTLPPYAKQPIQSHRPHHPPPANKRLSTLQVPRKMHHSKASRLQAGSLFREARKVDAYNPRESFLPLDSNIQADNATKIKIVLSAYSKLRGRPSGISSLRKPSRTDRLSRGEEGREGGEGVEAVPSLFCQPALSSLTRLILNHCNPTPWENELETLDFEASLEDFLGEEREADWINILCASTINPRHQDDPSRITPEDNPYEFPRRKTNTVKQALPNSSLGHSEYFSRA